MHRLLTALVAAVAILSIGAPAFAQHMPMPKNEESHIYTRNVSDAFAWMTVYTQSGRIEGAWCVAPRSYDQHGVSARIYEVRAEVSQGGCQRHPILLNQLRGFPMTDRKSNTMTYYIHGLNGRYIYNNSAPVTE